MSNDDAARKPTGTNDSEHQDARITLAVGTAEAFFRETVDLACKSQRAELSTEAQLYIAGLLGDFVRPDATSGLGETLERPLTLLLDEALQSPASERFERLKSIGDGTLYVAGFFGDHLEARGVDDGLVATIGGFAYESAGSMLRVPRGDDAPLDLFGELARKFRVLIRILADVAERTSFGVRTHRDALRLYEKWARTGSERIARMLAAQGLVAGKGGVA